MKRWREGKKKYIVTRDIESRKLECLTAGHCCLCSPFETCGYGGGNTSTQNVYEIAAVGTNKHNGVVFRNKLRLPASRVACAMSPSSENTLGEKSRD